MKLAAQSEAPMRTPMLMDQARALGNYLKTLSVTEVAAVMGISMALAEKTRTHIMEWGVGAHKPTLAIDTFVGDIYSGLQANSLSADDRAYADQNLRILSGLYGILRPLDGVELYRLEMSYRLPQLPFANLYDYWHQAIVKCLPPTGPIINLAAVEYAKTITPYVDHSRLTVPRFLTVNPQTGVPTQVVVHTKIARGAYARWLIQNRINSLDSLIEFQEIGYHLDAKLSTPRKPTYVCRVFGGKGLSVRLG